jgi:hypothetical protein
VPKIADFGLAKSLEGGTGQTASGPVVGTPSYMAPEQARGGRDVGPLADVYALGAILYAALTGRPPFHAASDLDTVRQVVGDDPVPPRRLQPQVPRDLETICLKCLRKEPARRYPGAAAQADDLRRFLEGRPIQARPASWAERGLKWSRRHPAWAAVILLTLLGVATLGGTSAWFTTVLRQALAQRTDELQHEHQARLDQEQANRRLVRRSLYVSQMSLAYRFWQEGGWQEAGELVAGQTPNDDEEDLRGFEWHHLRCQLERRRRTTAGLCDSGKEISRASLAPDGRIVAAAESDGNLRLWNLATGEGRTLGQFVGDWSNALAFAPDGRTLASAHHGGATRLWDVATGGLRLTLAGHNEPLLSVAFSPDGTTLATGTGGGRGFVRLWDARKGSELVSFPKGPSCIAWSPDGHTLAATDGGESVYLIDTAAGLRLLQRKDEAAQDRDSILAFAPDGRSLLIGGANGGSVLSWEVATGRLSRRLTGHEGPLTHLAFSRDGQVLAAGTDSCQPPSCQKR